MDKFNSFRFLLTLFFYKFFCLLIQNKKAKKLKSILYFSTFFPENAGYHWRAKKWADELEKEGYSVDIACAINKEEFYGLQKENPNRFLRLYLRRRFWQVVNSRKYETVIVRRELLLFNDYGNLFLEKLLLKIHPNAILDFDDDIAASKKQPKKITNRYAQLLQEHGNKFNESLRMYSRFIVASNYLKEKVLVENKTLQENAIIIIPTCVDYDQYESKKYEVKPSKITFGWIGGTHNYHLLDTLIPVFNQLARIYDFELTVIGGELYERETTFKLNFVTWSLETEIDELLKIDIGLMPLDNSNNSKGKGGFKLIQYMGLGIVSVASAVTINNEIVTSGEDSFLIENQDDWYIQLEEILSDKVDLILIGQNAYQKVKAAYSFSANSEKYSNFIKNSKYKK